MNPQKLYTKHVSGEFLQQDVYYCEKCGLISRDKNLVSKCCVNNICECGADVGNNMYTLCEECRSQRAAKKEKELLENAEIVERGYMFYYCGNYYDDDSFYAYLCELDKEDLDLIGDYAWHCDELNFNAGDVIGGISGYIYDNFYEDCWEQVKGIAELEKAIQEFEKVNSDLITYEENYKKKVLIKDIVDAVKEDHNATI